MSSNLSVSSSAPYSLSQLADSSAVKWASRALIVGALALASLGILTIKISSIQSTLFLSIAFPVGLGSVSLLARQSLREAIGIDQEKTLREIQVSWPHLKPTYKKIYYHIDEKVFSQKKGIGFKQRRMTLYRLANGNFHIKSHQEIGSGTKKTAYLGEASGSSTVRTKEKNPPQNHEILIYKQLEKAKHVVHCYGVVHDDEKKRSLILEYCEKGDFKHVYERLNFPAKLTIIRDALLGLSELHEIGFLHLDCNLGNIFVTAKEEGRLADFGSCRPTAHLNDKKLFSDFMPMAHKLSLPILYSFLAPEIVFNIHAYKDEQDFKEITGKADIWMLGMALAQKLCPTLPAYTKVMNEQKKIHEAFYFCPFLLSTEQVNQYLAELMDDYPKAPKDEKSFEYLLWKMIHPDPNQRYSELEAVQKIDEILASLS